MPIFRYPGGKTKLLPAIQGYLDKYPWMLRDGDPFHDVFVGGGSVLLHIARHYPRSPLHANDLDPWIHAFWKVVSGTEAEFDALVTKLSVTPTVDLFKELRAKEPGDNVERAYYAVFFNRTTFSGILRSGPIGGYDQKSKWGVSCRYNVAALTNELLYMRQQLDLGRRLTVHKQDAVQYATNNREFMYLDPPYIGQGKALYRETVDHHALADALRPLGRWLLSYDDCEDARKLYRQFAHLAQVPTKYSIRGKKHSWTGNNELMITPRDIVEPWEPLPSGEKG